MSNVTASANIRVPTQPPVDAFSDATHEAFHEYLRSKPNRFRFTDEKYDLFRSFLLQEQEQNHSRETSPVLSEYFEKDKKRRAKILALRDFCLDDENRLCRKGTPPLIVLRDWQLYTAIVSLHCQIPHGGQEKTFIRLSEQYYGIIRPEVRWLLKHCKVCGLNRPNRTRPPLEPIVVSRLFERVQIDLIDMRHEPDDQFKWIIHMKDHWSKLCMLMPSTSKRADEIAQYITDWIYVYGPPEMLQSDNGGEFKGAVETILKSYGIKIKHGRPRIPQVQGLVEQANGVVQNRLAKWETETGSSEWVNSLPIIQMGINNTKHSATLKTPYEIVFGRKMVTSALVQETVNWRENRQSASNADSASDGAESEAEVEADDDIHSSILSLNRALDEDADIIANFQSIDITTLPPKLHERVQIFLAKGEYEDDEQLDSEHEESEVEESEIEESEIEEPGPEESDDQQMEVEANIRDKIHGEVTARGAIVRERMATRYNKRHNVEIFEVRDIISVGIPREDRAKTDNKRLYCRIIAKPHPDRHQLLSQYGILIGLYPTKALQRASPMLEHEFPPLNMEDIEHQKTITLANAARQASTSVRISVSCTCKLRCTGRCRCIKNNLKCSIYCHTNHTLPEDHDCGNLSTLATRTQPPTMPVGECGDK